jgi:hypothetical protein
VSRWNRLEFPIGLGRTRPVGGRTQARGGHSPTHRGPLPELSSLTRERVIDAAEALGVGRTGFGPKTRCIGCGACFRHRSGRSFVGKRAGGRSRSAVGSSTRTRPGTDAVERIHDLAPRVHALRVRNCWIHVLRDSRHLPLARRSRRPWVARPGRADKAPRAPGPRAARESSGESLLAHDVTILSP